MLQMRAIRVVTNFDCLANTGELYKSFNILKVNDMYTLHVLVYTRMYRTIHL